MSKQQRKSDNKDNNNISSKLLGANINDINIQKFRDLTQYNTTKYQLCGNFSISLLKIITNKFSSNIIFTINLPNQAIGQIDALSQCENLMVLNLSYNSIDNIKAFEKLWKLRIINLSHNSINNIQALGSKSELVNLNLSGNLIQNITSIQKLQNCSSLKNLHFRTISQNNSEYRNPLCEQKSYRESVLALLPQVNRLDGIPKNIDFSNGSQLDIMNKKQIKLNIKTIGPFYTTKFPKIVYNPPTLIGQTNLKKSINTCKSTLEQLESKLKKLVQLF